MGFVYKKNIEHYRKSHNICVMDLGEKTFSLAFEELGVSKDKLVIVV